MKQRAFTLIEVLIAIGLIAILFSITIAVVIQARQRAQTTSCLFSMRQLGVAYSNYATENAGWWPMAWHRYAAAGNTVRDKRWYDFIGVYIDGGILVNWDGTGAYRQDAATGRVLQLNLNSLRSMKTPLWGCPRWDTTHRYPGYGMNVYTFAPYKVSPTSRADRVNGYQAWSIRSLASALPRDGGWYFRAAQWSKSNERALLAESVWPVLSVGKGAPMQDGNNEDSLAFSLDTVRHKLARSGTPSLNILFCDGHASTLTPGDAYTAVRMVRN